MSRRRSSRPAARLARRLAQVADETLSSAARKQASRHAAALAERLGLIERPARCQWCRHRAPLNRHHDDHREPLAILFLCCGCHAVADRINLAS